MRRPDWLARLNATVQAARGREFRIGEFDCVRFAAECVEAMTGRSFDLPYTDPRSAVVALRNGLEPQVTARLGEPSPGLPKRGDVCLVETDDGEGLGISMGSFLYVPKDKGLGAHPITDALRHWRV